MKRFPSKDMIFYRPDIDGLRAIAVLAVIFFHAFPHYLRGGFAGVDIFFVISGYLIGLITLKEIEEHKFSILAFYIKRINRLVPSLILLFCICLALGEGLLLADEYKQLSKHLISSANYVENFLLWSESGYFDSNINRKPLAHLWSLGVEAQFYLLWPAVLLIGFKIKRAYFMYLLATAAFFSFGFALYEVRIDRAQAFFSPISRLWELLAGSFIAILQQSNFTGLQKTIHFWFKRHETINESKRMVDFVSCCGLLLIAWGFLKLSSEVLHPGVWTLLPVIGTMLTISAGSSSIVNKSLLTNPLLVCIGLISYPLYLWHWVCLSFVRIVTGQFPSSGIATVCLLISFFMAWITYQFIELPALQYRKSKCLAMGLIFSLICLSLIGFQIYFKNGLADREITRLNVVKAEEPAILTSEDCGLNTQNKALLFHCIREATNESPSFMLIGDSKALALYKALFINSVASGRWTSFNGVYPHIYASDSSDKVTKDREDALKRTLDFVSHQKNIRVVVIVNAARTFFAPNGYDEHLLNAPNNYNEVYEGLKKTVTTLLQAGKKVVFVTDNPTLAEPKDCIDRLTKYEFINRHLVNEHKGCEISLTKHFEISRKYYELLESIRALDPASVHIFDTTSTLCDIDKNICTSTVNNTQMYSYTDHISYYAANRIGRELNTYLNSYIFK